METETLDRVVFLRAIRRGLVLVIRADPAVFLRLVALNFASGWGPPMVLWLGKVVIDSITVTTPQATSVEGWIATLPTYLLAAMIGFVLLNVVLDSVATLTEFQLTTLGDRVAMDIQARLLAKTSGFASIAVFEKPEFMNLLVLADNAITRLRYLVMVLSQWMDGLFVMVPTIVLSATIAWWVPFLLFLTAIPSVVFQFIYERRQWSAESLQATKVRTMRAHEEVLFRPTFAKDLRMYGLADYFLQRWIGLYRDRFAVLQQIRRQGTVMTLAWSLLSGLSAGIPYIFVVYQATRGQMTIGDVALYAGLVFQVRRSIYSFLGGFGGLQHIALGANALFEVLDYDEMAHSENPVVFTTDAEPLEVSPRTVPDISLVEVTFTYPEATTPAVEGINLRIGAGETVVIVGENGAGKTTLAKLLCRLYAPTTGTILLNGQDYRLFSLDSFRRRVAVVFQDFARFPTTLRENIGFGDLSDVNNDERVRRAAAEIGLTKVIASLPQQLDTLLSKELEEGMELSGGQWQRVAIARALMRTDAPLVILDEPTASLDPKTEFEVLAMLRHLTQSKTAVIISHRLALAKIATTVIVMEHGKIIERGTHDALMQAGGAYAEMFTRQASSYV